MYVDLKGVWGSQRCPSVRLCGRLRLKEADTRPAQGNSSLAAAFCSPHGDVCERVRTSTSAADYRAASRPALGWTARQDSFPGWLRGCMEDLTSSYFLKGIPTYQRAWRAGTEKCTSACNQSKQSKASDISRTFAARVVWIYTGTTELPLK